MAMLVVQVRHMGVLMRHRFMPVLVAVWARGHRVMPVNVVPIVVGVGMFVFQSFVKVLVLMGF